MFQSTDRREAVWSAHLVANVPFNVSFTTCEIFTLKWLLCSAVEAG
jgi:hypothetical protein